MKRIAMHRVSSEEVGGLFHWPLALQFLTLFITGSGNIFLDLSSSFTPPHRLTEAADPYSRLLGPSVHRCPEMMGGFPESCDSLNGRLIGQLLCPRPVPWRLRKRQAMGHWVCVRMWRGVSIAVISPPTLRQDKWSVGRRLAAKRLIGQVRRECLWPLEHVQPW